MFSTGVQKIKLSKKFHEICVKIGECKSREEEEQIVSDWMANVKQTLGKQKLRLNQLYENVVSLIHLTLLGYNTSFGHIHAVNLTQDSQMQTKALGYLACAALLDSKSDLLILIINSTQRDLSSGQSTSMSLALTAICHLVTTDLIPAIIGYVGQALTHTIPVIRQKAVMCIHSFITKDPSAVIEFFPELVRLLSDPDLSVVNAVVNTFATLLKNQLNIQQICECLVDVSNVCTLIQNG
jgi:AP-4 complex subunit epsilon-1